MELTVFLLLTYAFESDAIRQLEGKLPCTVLHTLVGSENQEGSENGDEGDATLQTCLHDEGLLVNFKVQGMSFDTLSR